MKQNQTRSACYFLVLGIFFVVGACLRLEQLPTQIFLNDEWHSLKAVIFGKSCWNLLTRFNPSDNSCLLFNLYDLALYRSFGWTEITLRLPVILAGLASLIILPLMGKKMFNGRVSIILAGLLAISPILIFYSRYVRAYGLAALLCFTALLFCHQWLTTGKIRYLTGYVLAGALAIYAHLFSGVAVFMPLLLAIGFGIGNRFNHTTSASRQIVVSVKTLFMVGFVVMALLLPMLWPVLLQSANLPWERGGMTLNGVITAANLLAGTGNIPLSILFFLLLTGGCVLLFRRNPLLGWVFLSIPYAYILVFLASRPADLESGVVMLRYMIVVVPMALTLVALAIDFLLQQVPEGGKYRSLKKLSVAAFLGLLYAAGPLPEIYRPPNNFTNHSAFQRAYQKHLWEFSEADTTFRAFRVSRKKIPAFYHWLPGQTNIETLIEYPSDINDYNNLFYYYQHFHQKRVIEGYSRDRNLLGYKEGFAPMGVSFTIGILSADDILSYVEDPAKLKFRNLVDVASPAAILSSKADILVLHKYIMALKITKGPPGTEDVFESVPAHYKSSEMLKNRFEKEYGPPMYEDDQITCFRIKRELQIN